MGVSRWSEPWCRFCYRLSVSPSATAHHTDTRGNLHAEAIWVRQFYMKQHRRADLSSEEREEERPLRAAGSAGFAFKSCFWTSPGQGARGPSEIRESSPRSAARSMPEPRSR